MTRSHPPAGTLARGAPDTPFGVTTRSESRLSGRLSTQQQAEFAQQGYLIVPDVLPVSELAALDAEFEASYRQRLADPQIAADEQRRNQIHQLGSDSATSRKVACDERILRLVQDLVYPGIALFSAKLISKGPHEPHNVCHWHQDEAYWHIHGASTRRMSIWLALRRARAQMG